jgi:hypothetical protein
MTIKAVRADESLLMRPIIAIKPSKINPLDGTA